MARLAVVVLILITIAGTAIAAEGTGKPAAKGAAEAAARIDLPEYEPPPAYREEIHMSGSDHAVVMKRYYDGTKIRTELQGKDVDVVMIELGDAKGTTITLMPKEKQAIKQSQEAMAKRVGDEDEAEPSTAAPEDFTLEDLGDVTLDGVAAKKIRMVSKDGEVLGWIEKANGAPLRFESLSGEARGVIEFKNRAVGKQPKELFEVPKGYEVMDLDEMMGGMGGMPGMGGMGSMIGGQMGQSLGGSLGSSLGAAFGGPLGAAAGQYLGGKIGGMLGRKAGGVVD